MEWAGILTFEASLYNYAGLVCQGRKDSPGCRSRLHRGFVAL